MRLRIPRELLDILTNVFSETKPYVVEDTGKRAVRIRIVGDPDAIVEALGDELCRRALDSDGEVNEYGVRLDRLIGVFSSACEGGEGQLGIE